MTVLPLRVEGTFILGDFHRTEAVTDTGGHPQGLPTHETRQQDREAIRSEQDPWSELFTATAL